MYKCFRCGSELIWQNDYDSEDIGICYDGITNVLMCSNEDCNCMTYCFDIFDDEIE